MLARLLSSFDINIENQRTLSASLSDWQDSDRLQRRFGSENVQGIRNGLMPDIREWLLLESMNTVLFDKLRKNFTLYGTSHLNLMNSPLPLLKALAGNEKALKIVSLREGNSLSKSLIYNILGTTDYDEVFYSPSNTLAITILINYGEAQVKQALIIEFSPYANGSNFPYNIMQKKGG
jgi:type II secretory pathway component PulK